MKIFLLVLRQMRIAELFETTILAKILAKIFENWAFFPVSWKIEAISFFSTFCPNWRVVQTKKPLSQSTFTQTRALFSQFASWNQYLSKLHHLIWNMKTLFATVSTQLIRSIRLFNKLATIAKSVSVSSLIVAMKKYPDCILALSFFPF